jgi:hypothetical protein
VIQHKPTSDRRRTIRSVRRDLRRHGCTCTPNIAPLPAEAFQAAGMLVGADVLHQLGCRMGDRMLALNRTGVWPTLVSERGVRPVSRRHPRPQTRVKNRKRPRGWHRNADSAQAGLVELPSTPERAEVDPTGGAPTPLRGKANTDKGDAL